MAIVRTTFEEIFFGFVTVVVEKPNALAFVDGARVEITRALDDFGQEHK